MQVNPEDLGVRDPNQIKYFGDGFKGRGKGGERRNGFGGPSYDIAHEYNCGKCSKLV